MECLHAFSLNSAWLGKVIPGAPEEGVGGSTQPEEAKMSLSGKQLHPGHTAPRRHCD